jgi:lipid-binding SYLF domain-containing protein
MKASILAIPLTLLLAVPAVAATGMDKTDTATLSDSVTVLNAIADAPDKGIPQELFARAECILVFPSVTKAAFIVGGKGGHGVASCRQPDGRMGPPAMYTMGGASVGFQAGVDQTDFVMLVMNETGIKHLLQDKFTIGAEATARVCSIPSASTPTALRPTPCRRPSPASVEPSFP